VDSISLVPVLEGVFSRPVYLTHALDERLFIVEQSGVVHILKDGQLLEDPFLDIQDRVGSSQLEQGLLSIAFHPDYQQNGRFFADYTDADGTTHISSFTVSEDDPDRADVSSEVILLSVDQPFPNHNGGQLKFGPDGYLYVGLGDGGSANDPLGNGQDPNTLLGSLLRLDVDHSQEIYAIPDTNPFISDENRRNELWAWGLRNPWRFSFDKLTGDLFIADVGQNLWEEVHFQPAASQGGENYGWNIMEASNCFLDSSCDKTGLELPIFEYNHQEGCSITGGYMYRGHQFLSLYGNYFVADFCSGNIWSLYPETEESWSSTKVLDSDLVISSFGEDVNGDLYILVHDDGSLFQIQP
jgi:glucose/arabinose dehydrogenase